MFCVAFGLSMDYEVFLLSRIKEEYDRTGDNEHAVAAGLEHTGRIVTAAALLLAVTFLSFATSGITFIKLFGLGLAMAVVMDATIVRALLVPAFMKLAGDANWWAPGPLERLQQRFGLHEAAPDEVDRAAADSALGQPVGDDGQGGAVLEEERVPTVEPTEIRALDLTGERLLVGGHGDAVEAARGDQDG
jgi:RND superfamily putative drug exporter